MDSDLNSFSVSRNKNRVLKWLRRNQWKICVIYKSAKTGSYYICTRRNGKGVIVRIADHKILPKSVRDLFGFPTPDVNICPNRHSFEDFLDIMRSL
jgi:hypothetical protein